MTSVSGTDVGDTKITVSPAKSIATNKYKYKLFATEQTTLPALDEKLTTGWTVWDGTSDITATNGYYIVMAEVDKNNGCDKVGQALVVSKTE